MSSSTSSIPSGSAASSSSPSRLWPSTPGRSIATLPWTSSLVVMSCSPRWLPTTSWRGGRPRGAARPPAGGGGGVPAGHLHGPGRPAAAQARRRLRMSFSPQYKWFFETTTEVEGHLHAIARTISARQTKFQFMEILETLSYGKVLVLDGRIQSSQADDFMYHELLVHPRLLAHPNPKRAMVIGGGEGATVREILRHRSITDCLMVDIDAEVVEEC